MNSTPVSKITDNRNIRVIQFLDAYERQDTLWNPNSENYKNKTARDEAYTQIIQELKMPSLSINDVKLKVKSIRTTYKKELRILKKHQQEGKPYQPKLFWFNRADSFLKNVSVYRNKILGVGPGKFKTEKPYIIDYVSPLQLKEPEENITDDIEDIEECIGPDSVICNSDVDTQSQDNNILDSRPVHDSNDTGPLLTKLCYRSNSNQTINRDVNETLNPVVCNTNIVVDDEYDLFCKSVAVQLRSIRDNYSRSVAKLKIQQILFEAETGHYRNTACVTIPVSQNLTTL